MGKENLEGYFFPKSYMIHKDTGPESVAEIMVNTYSKETKNIKKSKITIKSH